MIQYGFQAHLSPEFPSQIIVDVTENCNLACTHCPHSSFAKSRHYAGRNLDPQLNGKLVDEVREDGKGHCHYLRYTGAGETLLHPNLIEMITYASRNSGVPINLTTNGTLLDEHKAKELLDAGVAVFDFSIDAYNEKTYRSIRRNADLKITRANVLRLIELNRLGNYKSKMVVSFVEQPLNQEEKSLFQTYWRKAGADDVVIRPMHSAGGAVKRVAKHMRANLKGQRKPCLYPWERLVLNPLGQIGFCPAEWDYQASFIDFRKATIKEIWKSDFMRRLREAHLQNDFSHYPFCEQCPDWAMTRWPDEGRSYSDMMHEIIS
jgi:sulfatase maturation enzyme AslB (radical SAM superfamily)